MMESFNWADVIQSVGVIVLGYFTYNQYTKNKLTDIKVDQIKEKEKAKRKRRNENTMIILEELWNLLFELKADRVYIVQPHPLGDEELLTIHYEVLRKGRNAMKPQIQKKKINEVTKFAAGLCKTLFMYVTDIEKQIDDRYAQSIFSCYGTKQVVIKRLSDNTHDWVGNIICEFQSDMVVCEESAKSLLHSAATNIQYILPEIEE